MRDDGGAFNVRAETVAYAQRNILADLIERVVAVRVSYGKYNVEITWTPLGLALGQFCESVEAA